MRTSRVTPKTLAQKWGLWRNSEKPPKEFNDEQWVVSLINTANTIKESLTGGHAKIIVEGIKNGELYVGSFHIITTSDEEALENIRPDELDKIKKTLPNFLTNPRCKYIVICRELGNYNSKILEQYKNSTAISWERDKECVKGMVDEIRREANTRTLGDYEYFGKFSFFGHQKGENCITWAKEKLLLANIDISNKADCIKAKPEYPISCSVS